MVAENAKQCRSEGWLIPNQQCNKAARLQQPKMYAQNNNANTTVKQPGCPMRRTNNSAVTVHMQ